MKLLNDVTSPANWPIPLCRPVRIESHRDAPAHASKDLGFDEEGRRCYYRHAFTLYEDRFDAVEWPEQVAVYRETLEAWRLIDGRWLSRRSRCERPQACPHVQIAGHFEFSETCPER